MAEAATLFNHRGFERGSMSDLMKATGLENSGICRHFSSEEEVAVEAFDYGGKRLCARRMYDVEEVPNSVDRLERFVANFVERRPSVPGDDRY
jgi:AcrR family transcriptional regulator